jgi:hypothetical protein
MQSCQLEAEHPLKIKSRLVVSLTLPEKEKVRSTRQILKIEIKYQSEAQ